MRLNPSILIAIGLLSVLCVNAQPDFADYPDILIEDNSLNAVIVVGDEASPEDVVGAIEIGTSLQYSLKEVLKHALDMEIREVAGGFKIDRTGNHLSVGIDSIADVIEVIDDSEMPVLLADEIFEDSEGETDNKERYTQQIRFFDDAESGVVKLYQPKGRDSGSYVLFDNNDPVYGYTLEFEDPIEYTNSSASDNRPKDDLEDTLIKIQGKEYTIASVNDKGASGNYEIDKIKLMAGDNIVWLQQGKTLKTFIEGVEHEIEVSDVNDNENMCGVSVDDDTVWIDVDQTKEVNGVKISVSDAIAIHAQLQDVDICKLNLGASEITLEDEREAEINGKEVDGSIVYFKGSPGEWEGFNISYEADEDIYLGEEEELLDPVLQNFKLVFGGANYVIEAIEIETMGDDSAELIFKNNDGREVVFPFYFNGSAVLLGEDEDEPLLHEGDVCDKTSVDDCEDYMIFAVTKGEEAHIIKITDIDTNNDQMDFKDETYGKTYKDRDYTDSTSTPTTFWLSGIGSIQMIIDETNGIVNVTDSVLDQLPETSKGATITIDTEGENATIHLLEETDDETADYVTNISIKLYPDLTDEEIDIARPTDELVLYRNTLNAMAAGSYWPPIPPGQPEAWYVANMANGTFGADLQALYNIRSLLSACGWLDITEGNSDTLRAATVYSTDILWDNENHDFVAMSYPDNEITADFFIAPADSELEEAEEIEMLDISRVDVGTAKLASEIEGREKTQNVLAVGGPCKNKAAAVLMGLEFPACGKESRIREGTGILKLFENNGFIGIVVAGYSATETRAAARVLAEYGNYSLAGTDLEVTFTSLEDIEVGEPIVVEEEEEEAPEIVCKGTNPASDINPVTIRKFGIKKDAETNHIITMHGTEGEVLFVPEAIFRSQLGIEWLTTTYHILAGECSSPGEEVFSRTVKWVDGEKEKLEPIVVPEPGCYCFVIENKDLVIDDASIEIADGDIFTIDFRT